MSQYPVVTVSPRSRTIAAVLAFFLGVFKDKEGRTLTTW